MQTLGFATFFCCLFVCHLFVCFHLFSCFCCPFVFSSIWGVLVQDIETAARIVLYDWQRGRIPYFTAPPEENEEKQDEKSGREKSEKSEKSETMEADTSAASASASAPGIPSAQAMAEIPCAHVFDEEASSASYCMSLYISNSNVEWMLAILVLLYCVHPIDSGVFLVAILIIRTVYFSIHR